MAILQFHSLAGVSEGSLAVGISDVHIGEIEGIPFVLTTTGPNGGLLSFNFSPDGGLALIDRQYFPDTFYGAVNGALHLMPYGNGSLIAIGGDTQGGMFGYTFDSEQQIGPLVSIADIPITAVANMVVTYSDFGHVYTATSDRYGGIDGEVISYVPNGTGGFTAGQITEDTDDSYMHTPVGLVEVQVAGRSFLLGASATEKGLTSYEMDPQSGDLTRRDAFGAEDGFGIMIPVALATAQTADGTYVITASSSSNGRSGALSVMRVEPNGRLTPTDHALDTRDTRVGAVSSVAVVEDGDWTYVLVGGGDDGLSLFQLLPDGRLFHLDSIADSIDMGLENLNAIDAVRIGDALRIVAASQYKAGLTVLEFSLAGRGEVQRAQSGGDTLEGSAADDLLMGGKGNDSLTAQGGDDILKDGDGSDTLIGGTGSDSFMFVADGLRDRIENFEPGIDWLDLSLIPMAYSISSFGVTETADGALIVGRGEEIEIHSISGSPLSQEELALSFRLGADHPMLNLRSDPMAPLEMIGTNGADTLVGNEGDDTLLGSHGDDLLMGENGDDFIDGDTGHDTIKGGKGTDTVLAGPGMDHVELGEGNDLFFDVGQTGDLGRDTVYAGAGDDLIDGGGAGDSFYGEAGDDRIIGRIGDDHIVGGEGHDLAYGGPGADTLIGSRGNDTLHGIDGHDLMQGDAGDEVLFAGKGRDTVDAGEGRDRVFLSWGHDTFIDAEEDGQAGSDTVYGGLGHDTLLGVGGNDVLYGMNDNDYIEGGEGRDTIYGGSHVDTILGGDGDDRIWGGMGPDRADMGLGSDVFYGHPQNNALGQDTVYGGKGEDTIRGGGGDDVFRGDADSDLIYGGSGTDSIEGGGHHDELHGLLGNDYIDGGEGNDTIYGGVHADTLIGGEGNDTIWGGMGLDWVDMGSGKDVFHGHPQDSDLGQDMVFGGDGNDTILGAGGKDVFHGDGGNDLIYGGLGHDTIHGGAGDDTIDSGRGLDFLTGGNGADAFVFQQVDGFNTITDFGVGVDRLELDIGAPAIEDIEIEYWLKGTFLNWQDGQILLEGIDQSDFSIEDVLFI